MTIQAASTSTPAEPIAAPLAPPLRLFLRVQLLLVCLCVAIEIFAHFVLHMREPYDYPFLSPHQFFWDFLLFGHKFVYFHTPAFFTTEAFYAFSYPAPLAVFYEMFWVFGVMAAPLWFAVIVGGAFTATILFERALRRHGLPARSASGFALFSFLFAFPLWFDVKQGNVEFAIWVLVAAGVWAFCAEKNLTAAACIGLAGSMKIFPFIYLGLLLSRRKYREMAFAFALAAAVTIVSLWLVGGRDIANSWHQLQAGAALMRTTNMLHFRIWDIGWDHSLFALYKRLTPHLPPPETLSPWLTAYLVAAALAGTALYFLRIRHLPVINQVLCLCVASILLPPVSVEYTLMHLYVPWALMVFLVLDGARAGNPPIPGVSAAFVCFAILMSPLSEFIHHAIHYQGQIKCVVLVILMIVALRYPFSRVDGHLVSYRTAETI